MKQIPSLPDGSPPATPPLARMRLVLDQPAAEDEDPPARDISAAASAGDTLFLAADECADVEILNLVGDHFTEHRRVGLRRAFDLPGGDEEMDIEGLAVEDGWLWVVGSHSLTRKKPKAGKPLDKAALHRLAKLKDNDNRMFLGRLPLRRLEGGRWDVCTDADRERAPQMLPMGKHGTDLYRALKKDPHLGPFCDIPAKENGLDVEGIVVDGARVGLGLRGPVINGWAIVLELEIQPGKGGDLCLEGKVRKHFLDLKGLGIRDLKRRGDDVLVLAGPTMKLDGPAQVYRWSGWRKPTDDLHRPELLVELPYGRNCDHPEALAPVTHQGRDGLMVICDSPGPDRLGGGGVLADVFAL